MMRCPACREKIQSHATVCYKCRHEMTEKEKQGQSLDRLLGAALFVIVVGLMLFSTGCDAAPAQISADAADRKLVACHRFLDFAQGDGIITSQGNARIVVREDRWAAIPAHTKSALLEARICVDSGGQPVGYGPSASAWGYLSGKRLARFSASGFDANPK